jgi:Kef-type K+ transport system membrane component KefB
VVGAALGYVLALYLRKVQGGAAVFLLTFTFIIAEIGQRLHFDPLLVALAAGLFIRNLTTAGDQVHHLIEGSALPIYVLFFAVAGATLHFGALAVIGLPALLFVLVRGVGLLVGTRIGASLAGAEPAVRRYAGFGLLPQAGLALALAMLFAKTFPEFGRDAAALTLTVVAINEIIAPGIYRVALLRSGEATAPPSELLPQKLIGANEP